MRMVCEGGDAKKIKWLIRRSYIAESCRIHRIRFEDEDDGSGFCRGWRRLRATARSAAIRLW